MTEETSLDESFSLTEKILLYISKNEPIDNFQELIEKSGLPKDKIKLNIERLHSANLIEGSLHGGLGNRHFVAATNIKLSYAGLKETEALIKKGGVKEMEINLGLLKFKI
jgi:hypothetical protein